VEVYRQTGMSGCQQRQARATLVRLGLVEMRRRGTPAKLYCRINRDKLGTAAPVSDVRKPHVKMLENLTSRCKETAHLYIRNNKEYYRDNNKEGNADCAEGADDGDAAAPTTGEDLPCAVVVDESLVELLVKEGISWPAGIRWRDGKTHDLGRAGFLIRRLLALKLSAMTSACANEKLGYLCIACVHSLIQRRLAPVGLQIDVSAVCDQRLAYFGVCGCV